MHQIQFQLNDYQFQSLQMRATASGFESVNEYVVDMIESDLLGTPNLEHLFTPERMAIIDRAAAELDAGKGVTIEKLDEHLAAVREAWLKK